MTKQPKRILVFRIGQLGDTVIALPSLWVIREMFPHSRIDLVTNRFDRKSYVASWKLLEGTCLVDRVFSFPPIGSGTLLETLSGLTRLFLDLRRVGYPLVVYLAPSSRQQSQRVRDFKFFRICGIQEIIGAKGFPDEPGVATPYPTHEADRLLYRLSRDGIAIPSHHEGKMEIPFGREDERGVEEWRKTLTPDDGRPWIGVGVGSKMPLKVWPLDRYTKVCRELVRAYDIWPVVFGGPEDQDAGNQLIRSCGQGHVAAGNLSIRQSALALRECVLYLGNDTGTMHLAAAVGVPCVSIFSARSDPGIWNPYGSGHIILRKDLDCSGCMLTECVERKMECILSITMEETLSACVSIIDRRGGSVANQPLSSDTGFGV